MKLILLFFSLNIYIYEVISDEDIDWVNPFDMINYDHDSKRNSEKGKPEDREVILKAQEKFKNQYVHCMLELKDLKMSCNNLRDANVLINNESNIYKDIEDYKRIISYFNRLLRMIHGQFVSANELNLNGFYNLKAVLTLNQLRYLDHYGSGYENSSSIQEISSIITDMFKDIKFSSFDKDGITADNNSLKQILNENFQLILLIVVFILTTIHLALLFSRMHFNICKVLIYLTLILFVTSIPWTWWMLYKKAVAEKIATSNKGEPDECKNRFSFYSALKSVFIYSDDECAKYHESLQVDPLWDVTPTKALAVTASKFLLEPLEHLGLAIKMFFKSALSDAPFYMKIIILIFIIIVILLLTFKFSGYRIKTLLFTIEPSTSQNSNSLDNTVSYKKELKKPRKKLTILQNNTAILPISKHNGCGDNQTEKISMYSIISQLDNDNTKQNKFKSIQECDVEISDKNLKID